MGVWSGRPVLHSGPTRDRSLLSSASETAAGHARSSWSCRRSSREVFQEGERSSKREAYKQGSEREIFFGGWERCWLFKWGTTTSRSSSTVSKTLHSISRRQHIATRELDSCATCFSLSNWLANKSHGTWIAQIIMNIFGRKLLVDYIHFLDHMGNIICNA